MTTARSDGRYAVRLTEQLHCPEPCSCTVLLTVADSVLLTGRYSSLDLLWLLLSFLDRSLAVFRPEKRRLGSKLLSTGVLAKSSDCRIDCKRFMS